MTGYKARIRSRKEICELVRNIRAATGYLDILYFPIVEFLEFVLPSIVENFELEIVPSDEMKNKCGETIPHKHKIILNESIYMNAIEGDGFARFTIAHEIGHLLLHNTESISLCKLRPGELLNAYENPEWQANVFGGELLAPYYLIEKLDVDEIVKKCGITKKAATVQKSKLRAVR